MAQPPPENPETAQFATAPLPALPPPDAPPPTGAPAGPASSRRHRVPLLIATAVLILAGGGIGWALAASHGSTLSASPAASPTAAATGSSATPSKAPKRPLTRGVITRQSGDTWTLRTAAGATVAVTVSDKTQYGAARAPAQKAQFTVGTTVVVSGVTQNGTVVAKRIRLGDGTHRAPTPTNPTPSVS